MSYRYIILFTFTLLVLGVLDVYLVKSLKSTLSKKAYLILKWFIPLTTFLFLFDFVLQIIRGSQHIYNANTFINVTFGLSIGFFFTKLVMSIFFLIEDFVRIGYWAGKSISKQRKADFPSRRNFMKTLSLSAASIPLLGSIYAVTKGKYNYHVKRVELFLDRLPSSFDGLRVVQFSDFHAGSFDDHNQVKQGLALIREENPDVVLFTGDLVNNRAIEAHPYEDILKTIPAKYAKLAILGNHDYGDYIAFDNPEERQQNLEELEAIFQRTGFKLLKNENFQLDNGSDILDIIGVENWGTGPFPKYGDIDKASVGTNDTRFNILLSHDPDHWEYIIRKHPKFFDLTLSGHTHGAQMGVEIPGWKWSPVKYRYKRWLGLYKEDKRYLFVSKGFGFLGFPGRIGMWPEIVVFTLRKNSK
ncbi:MAG: metallophosphoesterase [Brumimicrobium sp.]|nr:metallophosphoesterase [Brumimicrobium sp.]